MKKPENEDMYKPSLTPEELDAITLYHDLLADIRY